jgi:hypothetical protein
LLTWRFVRLLSFIVRFLCLFHWPSTTTITLEVSRPETETEDDGDGNLDMDPSQEATDNLPEGELEPEGVPVG